MEEEWKIINEFPSYSVSNKGRVKRIVAPPKGRWIGEKLIKSHKDEKGYLRVSLRRNNKPFIRRIHVLVTNTFIGQIPPKHNRHHEDGDKGNNVISNLSFISVKTHRLIHPTNNFPMGHPLFRNEK